MGRVVMYCCYERFDDLIRVGLADDCENLSPQSMVRGDEVVEHDKGDGEAIPRYKLPASREQRATNPGVFFNISDTARYPWHLGPGEMTKTTTGDSEVSGV